MHSYDICPLAWLLMYHWDIALSHATSNETKRSYILNSMASERPCNFIICSACKDRCNIYAAHMYYYSWHCHIVANRPGFLFSVPKGCRMTLLIPEYVTLCWGWMAQQALLVSIQRAGKDYARRFAHTPLTYAMPFPPLQRDFVRPMWTQKN